MATRNTPDNSESSGRYKERNKKGPSVFVEQGVCAYKRVRVEDDEQPRKYRRQPKPRNRRYRPTSSVGLKSFEESIQEDASDLPLSEGVHTSTDNAVFSSEPESESDDDDDFDDDEVVDDDVDDHDDVDNDVDDERQYENPAHSGDETSGERYDGNYGSGDEIHGYQDRDSNDMEDNEDIVESESEGYKYLYQGCPLREDESIVLVSLYASRHHLTDVAVADLLKLLAVHCPSPNNCTKSLFRYKRIRNKQLSDNLVQTKKFVCGSCYHECSSKSCLNEGCSKHQKPAFKPCQLTTLSVFPQLQRLAFENWQQLSQNYHNSDSSKISDITDGQRYKEIKSSVGDSLISLIVNADGAPIFKSSNTSAWPLMCAVAELPPTARFNVDNMILAAVWCGRCKPTISLFVKAFVDELLQLCSTGITVTLGDGRTLTFQVRVVQVVADLPAKAQLLNQLQFNGTYGCSKCEHPGVRLEIAPVRVYPYGQYQLRTTESVSQQAQEAEEIRTPVYGVKGRSALYELVQIPDDVIIDYMHCVLEGVFKRLLSFWFSSEYHQQDFYLGRHRKRIDDKLIKICVPHDFGRKPRSLQDMTFFKATEYHDLMLYFMLPLVRHCLPIDHYHHFAVLVTAMTILLSVPTCEEVDMAGVLLHYFVKEMESLYGIRAMTINNHSLCHLAKQVRDNGPLWSSSMFPFENMVKELGCLYSGTKNTADQIVDKFQFRQRFARSCHSSTGVIDNFAVQLRLRRNRSVRDNTVKVTDDVTYFLPMPQEILLREEREAVITYTGIDITRSATPTRAIVCHEVYHSSTYARKGNTCSSLVEVNVNNSTIYGRVVKFILHQSRPIALMRIMHPHNLNICKQTTRATRPFLKKLADDCQLAGFYLPVEELDELIAVDCTSIRRKCIFIEDNDFHESVTGFLIPVLRDYRV